MSLSVRRNYRFARFPAPRNYGTAQAMAPTGLQPVQSGSWASKGNNMQKMFVGGVFTVATVGYTMGQAISMMSNTAVGQWLFQTKERNSELSRKQKPKELKAARTLSLKQFKESAFQQEDPREYGKTWKRFNNTALVRSNSVRPGGELSSVGANTYRQTMSSASHWRSDVYN